MKHLLGPACLSPIPITAPLFAQQVLISLKTSDLTAAASDGLMHPKYVKK